jgi:hypothetical protein
MEEPIQIEPTSDQLYFEGKPIHQTLPNRCQPI